MSEFGTEIAARVARTTRSLAAARAEQDDYLVSVLYGELESLARVAHDHDVVVPGLRESLGKHGESSEVHLPDETVEPTTVDLTGVEATGASERVQRIA